MKEVIKKILPHKQDVLWVGLSITLPVVFLVITIVFFMIVGKWTHHSQDIIEYRYREWLVSFIGIFMYGGFFCSPLFFMFKKGIFIKIFSVFLFVGLFYFSCISFLIIPAVACFETVFHLPQQIEYGLSPDQKKKLVLYKAYEVGHSIGDMTGTEFSVAIEEATKPRKIIYASLHNCPQPEILRWLDNETIKVDYTILKITDSPLYYRSFGGSREEPLCGF